MFALWTVHHENEHEVRNSALKFSRAILLLGASSAAYLFSSLNVEAAVPVVPGVVAAVPKTKPVDVLAFYFSSEDPQSARDLVNGQAVEIRSAADFLKLNVIFAQPLKLKRVVVESCEGEFQDGVEFMFHPGHRRTFVEGGKSVVSAVVSGDQLVRSMAVVFGHASPKCLKGFQIFDSSGHALTIDAPKLESAKIENSELRKLFDLGFQQSASFSNGVGSTIQFAEEQSISGLQVWNGNQLSNALFVSGEKMKGLSLIADGEPMRKLVLKPKPGLQTLKVEPALRGKKITIKPLSGGVVTELRFLSGKGAAEKVFVPFELQEQQKKLSEAYAESDLTTVLDRELTTRDDANNWHFRFRSDSTFFIYGYNDGENRRGQINGLGRYEILHVEPKKLKLKLRGIRIEAANLWDGLICGPPCGEPDSKMSRAIDETIVVEKFPSGIFMVRNRNAQNNRSLLFTDLKTKVSTLAE
jgi:hypothetical protein